jgi:hypothetical protein
MPEFIREMVTRGFWWAILASFIFALPFGVISILVGKKSKFLRYVFLQVPYVFFWFYIWYIRGHIGWLVIAIIGSIGIFIVLVGQLISNTSKKTDKGSNAQR